MGAVPRGIVRQDGAAVHRLSAWPKQKVVLRPAAEAVWEEGIAGGCHEDICGDRCGLI